MAKRIPVDLAGGPDLTDQVDSAVLAGGLAIVFGAEWADLAGQDRQLILRDCSTDGGVSNLAEYRRNIGPGNLAAYALCQRVRFRA
jgi:hypothetical protein